MTVASSRESAMRASPINIWQEKGIVLAFGGEGEILDE
jgi:hypothetical protein